MSTPEQPEMLSQPLLTEEGFLNPTCMNELSSVIGSMPETFQRLANDDEWSIRKSKWVFRHDITGAFAMWACRQSPYGVPEGLENVCKYLDASLKTAIPWNYNGMAELSLCDINKILHEILMDQGVEQFDAWNRCRVGPTPDIQFCSVFDGEKDPDASFIDLHALIHNVCLTIRGERRENEAFNARFEVEHGELK